MSNIAIITAKANNESLPNKNILNVYGKPFLARVIEAARSASKIDEVFVSTNGEPVISFAEERGCRVIVEPQPFPNHGDAIEFAIKRAEKMLGETPETTTILLGNTIAANSESITLAIEILQKNPEIDSVMTVWQAQDDHPYRALTRDKEGFLKAFLDVMAGTARQSYPQVYYYDQGPWTFRTKVLEKKSGPGPWWWMGEKCFPIVRNWVTGRDVHSELDVSFSQYWLEHGHKDEIINKAEINNLIG